MEEKNVFTFGRDEGLTIQNMCISIETILNLAESVAVTIASGVAIYGIDSWRKEAKWKRKYELAEEVLSSFYEVRDALRIIRTPFSFQGEGRTRVKGKDETKEESEFLDRAYVFIERYQTQRDSFVKLKTLKYRFMAIFEGEYEKYFNDINSIVNQMFMAQDMIRMHYGPNSMVGMSNDERKQHMEGWRELDKKIYSIGNNNEIDNQIDDIITNIEKVCKKIIVKP